MNKTRQKGIQLALAFAGTYGISYLINFRDTHKFSFSILTVFLMIVIYFIYDKVEEHLRDGRTFKERRKELFYSGFASWALGTTMVLGYQLQYLSMTDGGVTGKLGILLRGICVGAAAFPLAEMFFRWIGRESEASPAKQPAKSWKLVPLFFCSWLGIWLCWVPVWLAYYPVIMSYDFHSQSLQVFVENIYDRQPVTHTILIALFRDLGIALGSYEAGLALFCQMQQMILSAALGYAVVMIYRLTAGKVWTIITAVLFAVFPVISVFAMCSTKDVLFCAFFVLFFVLMAERSYFSETPKKQLVTDIFLVIAGILMILFRNNAWHALLAAAVILLIFSPRREKLRILIIGAALIIGGPLVRTGIEKTVDASKSPGVEEYSVIIQCFARVGYIHRDTMSQETFDLIDTYVGEEVWEDYNPAIADGVKSHVEHTEYEEGAWDNMGEVIAAWIRVGLQYPNEYLDAILETTRGYWFLDDTSHAEMLGTEDGMGLIYTYNSFEEAAFEGLEPISRWIWLKDKLERVVTRNCYYELPLFSNLFKPALWCWIFVLTVLVYLYRREKQNLKIAVYPLFYFGTILLGPTAIIRYVIPFILTVPVMLALAGHHQELRRDTPAPASQPA